MLILKYQYRHSDIYPFILASGMPYYLKMHFQKELSTWKNRRSKVEKTWSEIQIAPGMGHSPKENG